MSPAPATIKVAVAIGNTTVQLASFAVDGQGAGRFERLEKRGAREGGCEAFLEQLPTQDCQWFVASVFHDAQNRLANLVRQRRPGDSYRQLSYRDVPLEVAVEQPQRVGMDRLAAAVAANAMRNPDQIAIVVDVGTAVTVNLLDERGRFCGGAILPGFVMAAQSLTEQTDLLPLVPVSPQDEPPPVVGTSTEQAIRSGLFWGIVGAVRELSYRMSGKSDAQVLVTGGGGHHLARLLGPSAQFVPELVLQGIAMMAVNVAES